MIIDIGNKIRHGFHPQSLYIAVEGCDGCGKSSFTAYFTDYLKAKQISAISIREPGQAGIAGQMLRKHILDKERSLQEQIELFRADRILTQELVVKPALRTNTIVLSDRSLLSSLVYQGWMSNSPANVEKIKKLYNELPNFVYPDLTIVGTVPVEVALERIRQRAEDKGEVNYFDQKDEAYHRKVHEYFSLSDVWYPHPQASIDFNNTYEVITKKVIGVIDKYLGVEL